MKYFLPAVNPLCRNGNLADISQLYLIKKHSGVDEHQWYCLDRGFLKQIVDVDFKLFQISIDGPGGGT